MTILGDIDTSHAIPRKSIAEGREIPDATIFIRRTVIEFLQVLFSTREPNKNRFHWNKDITQSEIQITDNHSVNLTDVNKRPMIIAVRGPISWQGTGLGGNSLESVDRPTGRRTFNDMLIGSVVLNCISREGVEADQLAQFVFNAFKFFSPVLKKFGFFTIKSTSIGAESLIKASGSEDETTLVPVYLNLMIQERWTLDEKVARTLQNIVIETVFQGGR